MSPHRWDEDIEQSIGLSDPEPDRPAWTDMAWLALAGLMSLAWTVLLVWAIVALIVHTPEVLLGVVYTALLVLTGVVAWDMWREVRR